VEKQARRYSAIEEVSGDRGVVRELLGAAIDVYLVSSEGSRVVTPSTTIRLVVYAATHAEMAWT